MRGARGGNRGEEKGAERWEWRRAVNEQDGRKLDGS